MERFMMALSYFTTKAVQRKKVRNQRNRVVGREVQVFGKNPPSKPDDDAATVAIWPSENKNACRVSCRLQLICPRSRSGVRARRREECASDVKM